MPTYDVIVRIDSTETVRVDAEDQERAAWVAEHGREDNDAGEAVGYIVDRFPDDGDRRVVSIARYEPDRPGYFGTYDARCAYAAEIQGLTPIKRQLRAAGIDFEEQQTGGFCMVLSVPVNGPGHRAYDTIQMTDGEQTASAPPGSVFVQYETVDMAEGGYYGDEPYHIVTYAELPSLIRQMKEGYTR